MSAPSLAPTDKVAASTTTGALGVLLAWILELVGLDVPPAVQVAAIALLMAAAGYIKTERGALAALLAKRRAPGEHSAG